MLNISYTQEKYVVKLWTLQCVDIYWFSPSELLSVPLGTLLEDSVFCHTVILCVVYGFKNKVHLLGTLRLRSMAPGFRFTYIACLIIDHCGYSAVWTQNSVSVNSSGISCNSMNALSFWLVKFIFKIVKFRILRLDISLCFNLITNLITVGCYYVIY